MEIVKDLLVKNKDGEIGRVSSLEEDRFTVSFREREAKYQKDAFVKGYLTCLDERLQQEVEEEKKANEIEGQRHLEMVKKADEASVELCLDKMAEQFMKRDEEFADAEHDESDREKVILLTEQPEEAFYESDGLFGYKRQCAYLDRFNLLWVEGIVTGLRTGTYESERIDYFHLGPIEDEASGFSCPSLGVYWELSKVFPCHSESGVPNAEYFAYRERFLKEKTDVKEKMERPWESLTYEEGGEQKKYKAGQALYYAYYDNEGKSWKSLMEADARKKILIPLYVKLMSKNPVYLGIVDDMKGDGSHGFALVGKDIFNYHSRQGKIAFYDSYAAEHKDDPYVYVPPIEDVLEIRDFKGLVNSPLPLGHAAILKAMLDGELSYDEYGLSDPHGILSSCGEKRKE